jgi:molybdenum cofactor synthesis domain-containing protein
MRPFTSLISIDEARRRISANVRPIDRVERVALAAAAGRVIAADIRSTIAVPPFARSAMDGFAVVAADTGAATREIPVALRVVDEIHAGQLPSRPVLPGTCAEIATGAPMPVGADAVVMVEDTRQPAHSIIEVLSAVSSGRNVSRLGADISPGDLVVRRAEVLSPSRLGAIAAVGEAEVDVYAKPRVGVLSTGNEVSDPGTRLPDGHIYNVNRFTLGAVIDANGGVIETQRAPADTIEALTAAFDGCAGADIVVFSGGSSVGNRDLVVDLVAARKGEIIFHGIAVKPGMPTAFARVGDQAVFGLPGNPTSCLFNAYTLLLPFLRATARLPLHTPRTVRTTLGRSIVSPVGRHQLYTVRLQNGSAFPAFKGSGDITSLSQADGYIEIAADQDRVEEGTIVDVVLF